GVAPRREHVRGLAAAAEDGDLVLTHDALAAQLELGRAALRDAVADLVRACFLVLDDLKEDAHGSSCRQFNGRNSSTRPSQVAFQTLGSCVRGLSGGSWQAAGGRRSVVADRLVASDASNLRVPFCLIGRTNCRLPPDDCRPTLDTSTPARRRACQACPKPLYRRDLLKCP